MKSKPASDSVQALMAIIKGILVQVLTKFEHRTKHRVVRPEEATMKICDHMNKYFDT